MKLDSDSILLRHANTEDSKLLFEWRNSSENYRFFSSPLPVTWREHTEWFNSALNNPFKIILIGEIAGVPFGVVRYDLDSDKIKAIVNIHLAPLYHGKKLGTPLLAKAELYLKQFVPTVVLFEAIISVENAPSQKVFRNNNFEDKFCIFQKKV